MQISNAVYRYILENGYEHPKQRFTENRDFVCETKEEYINLKNKSKKKIKNIFYRA